MRDLYAVLHVPPDADHNAIRASFRILSRQSHPDFGGDAHRMQAISEAWATLGRPDRRIAYDGHRADERATHPGATNVAATPAAEPDTLDFGRYQGWTIEAMAHQDPDYLEWLRRSPSGRSWRTRIDLVLADRAARTPIPPAPAKRRGFLGR
jgi:curved DNA-binding protein CbpA